MNRTSLDVHREARRMRAREAAALVLKVVRSVRLRLRNSFILLQLREAA